MIKKTPIEQLRLGMFISDMNAGWLVHPFLFNQLLIESEGQIAAIRAAGIREVFIDTARGIDAPDAPSAAEAAAATEKELLSSIQEEDSPLPDRISFQEEFGRARRIYADAASMVRTMMDDVRLGRPLELAMAEEVAEKLVGSVLRNGSAMTVICRLREQDAYTFRHSVSVGVLLANLARSTGAGMHTMVELALGGLIHDVGKMLVDTEILNKPGRLSDTEFEHMKSHVARGAELAQQTADIPILALQVLEEHHERYDGTGYPLGRRGEDISAAGRMAALCDVYDAITSERCYHHKINPAEGMRRIFEWSKHHFDPVLAHAFVRSVGIYPVGSLVRLGSGQLAVVTEQREASLLQPVVQVVFDARRNYYVTPRRMDLSQPAGAGERIVGHEDPEHWGIDVNRFLG